MSREIQPYHEELAGSLTVAASPDGVVVLAGLVAALRRRWLTVLLVWVTLAGLALPGVWLLKKPTFTATADVQVLPVPTGILDKVAYQPVTYDIFLRTQAELMTSHQVLRAALADPTVKSLPLLNEPADPLSALREALKVETLRNTQIVRVCVTRNTPTEATSLARAVVNAYMALCVEADKQDVRMKRGILEREQSRLRTSLDLKRKQKLNLAMEYGTASDTTFELLRESNAEYNMETKKNLETVELEILQLKYQIRQIEKGIFTELLPEETPAQQQAAIKNDPMVRSTWDQLLAESTRLARLRSGMTDEAKEVIEAREQVDRLKADLEKELTRAADDLEKDEVAMQKRMKVNILSRKKVQLSTAEERREDLKKRVQAQEAEGMKIGQRSLEIQSLQEKIDRDNKDMELVENEIMKLDIENQRPGRISIASDAEIRPDGVEDKRLKLSLVAAVGTLFLAMAAAFLRDRADPRVRAPQEVETGMGLQLLGAVPPLEELKSGRITQQEFAECYRLVRVNLLSPGLGATPPKSILVASAQASEGKTSLAMSLAASLAELGGRVLLVDGDIQAPQIGEVLAVTSPGSLKHVLLAERSLADSVAPSRMAGLDVLVGETNGDSARGALDNRSAIRLVQEATGRYDYVVIDSPPALGAADALVWAQAVDGVILSTFAGQSSVKAAQMACQRLRMVGARLLGAVICNLTTSARFYSYSYSSRSGRRDRDSGAGGDARSGKKYTPPVVHFPVRGDEPPGGAEGSIVE